MAEILSLREAVRRFVHDGDSVALEGFTHLIPTAAGQRGDALHFNAQKPHRIRSLGETQAELLVVIHSDE